MLRLPFLILLILTCVTALYSQENCSDILKDGIRDSFHFSKSNDFDSEMDSWILSKNFQSYLDKGDNGIEISLPIPKLGSFSLSNNSSHDDVQKFQNIYSNELNSAQRSAVRNEITNQIANESIINAWSNCMNDKTKYESGGLIIIEENISTTINEFAKVEIRWVPRLGVNSATLAENIQVYGGTLLTPGVSKGSIITSEWMSLTIKKDNPNSNVIVEFILADNLGIKSVTLLGANLEESKIDPKETKEQKKAMIESIQGEWLFHSVSFSGPVSDTRSFPPIPYTNSMQMFFREIYSLQGKNLGAFTSHWDSHTENYQMTISQNYVQGKIVYKNNVVWNNMYTKEEIKTIFQTRSSWLMQLPYELQGSGSENGTMKVSGRNLPIKVIQSDNSVTLELLDGNYTFRFVKKG